VEAKSTIVAGLHVMRAEARQHLGALKAAVEDYCAALGLLTPDTGTQGSGEVERVQGGDEQGDRGVTSSVGDLHVDDNANGDGGGGGGIEVSAMTLARGRCKLELEDYAGAREDFAAALSANPASIAASKAGPGRCCSPRHRVSFNSRLTGSKCVG
jgi:hypothetical protein